jgi:xanthine/uracil permease
MKFELYNDFEAKALIVFPKTITLSISFSLSLALNLALIQFIGTIESISCYDGQIRVVSRQFFEDYLTREYRGQDG